MKLNPLTTRKILKGLAVTSGFIAVSGIITSSILGCVAFAQLQNLIIPKPVEETKEKELVLQGDPQTPINTQSIKELTGKIEELEKNNNEGAISISELEAKIKELKEEIEGLKKPSEPFIPSGIMEAISENANKLIAIENKIQGQLGTLQVKVKDNEEGVKDIKKNAKEEMDKLTDQIKEVQELGEELKTIKEVVDAGGYAQWTQGELRKQTDRVSGLQDRIVKLEESGKRIPD